MTDTRALANKAAMMAMLSVETPTVRETAIAAAMEAMKLTYAELQPVAEWLIAEERYRGELAEKYWRDDILPAVRQADSGFLQIARQSMASLRRVHSPVRGDSWRSKPDEWYCGHCLNGDGSPTEWPCKSAEHLYTPDEWNMPPMPRGCPHEGECGGGYAHREYTTVAQTRACQPEWVCGTKHVGGES